MEAFTKMKLADCVDLLAGYAFKSDRFTTNLYDIPLVKGENVGQGEILWEISKRWPSTEWEELTKFQLRTDDVVIAMDRPWVPAGLKWAFIKAHHPKALLVQRCCRLRTKTPLLEQRYIRHIIGSSLFEAYIKPITTGVNVPHISGKQILDFEFLFPSVRIQKQIVSILSAYDDLIENCQQRIKILEQMARAIYREWFVNFRYPGHEAVPLVDSPLGPIPQGWEVKKLGDMCLVTDYVANGSFASLKANVEYRDEPDFAILIRGTDFNSGWNGKYVHVTEDSYKFLRKSELHSGDIVVTNVGNVGTTFFVPNLGKPMTLGPNSVLVRPHSGINYIFHYLRSDEGQHRMRGITSGVAQPKFNKTEFRSLHIIMPQEDLLQLFDSQISSIHATSENLRRSFVNLRRTRDLLLPRLLSGQIDLSEADPAKADAA